MTLPCLPVWELTEGIPSNGPHGLGLHKRDQMNDGSMSKAEICQQGIFWILKHPDTAGNKPASKWPAALGSRSRRGSRAGGCRGQLPFAPGLGTVPLVYGKLRGGIWLPSSPCRKEYNLPGARLWLQVSLWAPTPTCAGLPGCLPQ